MAPTSGALLPAQEVVKSFGGRAASAGLDLEVARGAGLAPSAA